MVAKKLAMSTNCILRVGNQNKVDTMQSPAKQRLGFKDIVTDRDKSPFTTPKAKRSKVNRWAVVAASEAARHTVAYVAATLHGRWSHLVGSKDW